MIKAQDILQIATTSSIPFDPAWMTEEHRVHGCQSLMYLHPTIKDGKIYFAAHSDALISKGLAVMLIQEMDGQTPEALLKTTPKLFEKVEGVISPGRSNGLASLWLKMQQQALAFLTKTP